MELFSCKEAKSELLNILRKIKLKDDKDNYSKSRRGNIKQTELLKMNEDFTDSVNPDMSLQPEDIADTIRRSVANMIGHYQAGARGDTIEFFEKNIQKWSKKGDFGCVEFDITDHWQWNGRNAIHALLSFPHGDNVGLDKPVVKVLLDQGAKILNLDSFGKLPSTTAYLSGNYTMADELLKLEEQKALEQGINIPEQSFPLREWCAQGLRLSHDDIRESFPELADDIEDDVFVFPAPSPEWWP